MRCLVASSFMGLCFTVAAAAQPEGLRLDHPTVNLDGEKVRLSAEDQVEADKAAHDDPALLWFRNGTSLRPAPGIDPSLGGKAQGILLLQFPGPVRKAWLDEVASLGIITHDHVQNHAMLVEVPEKASEGILSLIDNGVIRYVGPYPAWAKLDMELAEAAAGPQAASDERLITVLYAGPPAGAREMVAALVAIESEADAPIPFARGRALASHLPAIAALERVKWIEPWAPGHTQNIEAGMATGADEVVSFGVFTGAGIRVAVDDSGIAHSGPPSQCGGYNGSYHPDIASGRIADEWDFQNNDANPCDDDSHGSHVAGTIGGDGTMLSQWAGLAPGVTFLIYKDADSTGSGFGHFNSVLSRAASHDADIVGNSWGGGTGTYNINAQWADQATRGGWNGSDGWPQYMLITAATGNDNDLALSPATGKNVISVGATKDGNAPDLGLCWGSHNCNYFPGCPCSPNPTCGDRLWPATERICFSNYGPLDTDHDGNYRLKPDVVAPGTTITSLSLPYVPNAGFYRNSNGTSMAQPVVAGAAALLLDAYPEAIGWPEMAKARLLGTAMSMGNPYFFGHGMVDAMHAVFSSQTLETLLWVGSSIDGTGAERDWTFTVPSGFQQVRVYLVWSDPDSATTEVVDDLDLRVYDGTGGLLASSATFDDTVESVRLNSGVPGTWRVNVRGYNVPQPTAYVGVWVGVVKAPPSLSFYLSPDNMCVRPGAWMEFETSLWNDGHSVPASEITADLPDGGQFQMNNGEIISSDWSRSQVYQQGEMKRDAATNAYTLTTGELQLNVDRQATWRISADPAAPEGLYGLIFYGKGGSDTPVGDVADVRLDATPPAAVTGLTSTTHPIGTCWSQDIVWMIWNPSTDAGCGLDGYAHSWSQAFPEIPPAVETLDYSTNVFYQAVGESTSPWYFNLRPVDDAGNWGTTVSYGPIRIDSTPPGVVVSLRSESHPPYSCSTQQDVSMFWTPAPDDNCGTSGYSVAWSEGAPQMPDEVGDIGNVDHQTWTVPWSDAARYFSIRAQDAGTNWSGGYATYGPIWIDPTPGAVDHLMVERFGNDLRFTWSACSQAHTYRVFTDTSPGYPAPVQVGSVAGITELWEAGGALHSPIVEFYQVVGTNVCGAQGPR